MHKIIKSFILFLGCVLVQNNLIAAHLKIGVTPGPHATILEYLKDKAQRQGLELEIVEFPDYIQPNAALDQGDLDINSCQHSPLLNEQIKMKGFKLVEVAKTIAFPIGMYSKKVKKVAELPQAARIAVPGDAANLARALILLQEQKFIVLRDHNGEAPTMLDIIDNPKNLQIIEIDAPQLPRILGEVDAAIINTDYALLAGLNPITDRIAYEKNYIPYINIIVAREQDKNNPVIKKFISIYQTEDTKEFILKTYKGAALPCW